MEVKHEILTPYLDAAISHLADRAAPYGLLRRYSNSGGELTGNPWFTAGLLLLRPDDNKLVCEADLVSSLNLCVFRVYWENPLDIVHAFKCSVTSEKFPQVIRAAIDAFSAQISKLQVCTQEDLKGVMEGASVSEPMKKYYEMATVPIPPPLDLDDVPDGSMSPEEEKARWHVLRGDQLAWVNMKRRAALQEYRAALKIWSSYPKAHWRIGQLHYYARKPRYEKALAEFQETVRLAPEWSEGYLWCGNALDEIGRSDEAIEAYRKAIQLEPDDPRHHISLGACLDKSGRHAEAIPAFRRGIELEPTYGEMSARMYLADALKANDQLPEAIEQWRIVAKMEEWWDEDEGVAREAQDFLDQFAPSSFDITTL
ncbi:MAG TPA: tetratricopeptide repeat protein [Candidatus Sumerlaeota bacterium]|nr:tetratricopeptide repeat protein [Candidatus Sumerlaeota bacterium]